MHKKGHIFVNLGQLEDKPPEKQTNLKFWVCGNAIRIFKTSYTRTVTHNRCLE